MLYLRMSGNIAKPENPKFGVVFQGCLSPAAAPGVIPENQPPPGPFVGIVDSQIQSVQGLQSLPESARPLTRARRLPATLNTFSFMGSAYY